MRRLYRPALLIAALIGISACGGGGGSSSSVPGAASAIAPSAQSRAALSVGGPTCNVPADYPTIQAAVSAPVCATVKVAPGSYTENVVIARTVTLRGAQAGHDARVPRGAESIINGGIGPDVTVSANNVTVDGFTLNGPPSPGTAAIVMQSGNSGEAITNNIVNNPGRAASFTTSNTAFYQNLVKSTATASDGFQANTTPVQNVILADNTFGGATAANYNADITIIEGNSNIVVTGNRSNGDGTLIALFKTNHALVAGNTVIGRSDSSAIYIGGGDSNILVDCNTVSGATSGVNVTNIIGSPNSAVTIVGNNLHNNINGVRVGPSGVAAANTVVANRNRLTGNSAFGVDNESTYNVNAINNWWGAANGPGPVGPGAGDRVTLNVTYAPWLRNANGATCGEGGGDGSDRDGHDRDGHDGHDGHDD
ncbi:MAG: hypothetical protein QOF71_3564 [Candidatus Eremiobacteraeota bacterium]|jgi:hypothetical protein|nr:hypothetical protein [Candidatus Eremiobacteraeota bacterium]